MEWAASVFVAVEGDAHRAGDLLPGAGAAREAEDHPGNSAPLAEAHTARKFRANIPGAVGLVYETYFFKYEQNYGLN